MIVSYQEDKMNFSHIAPIGMMSSMLLLMSCDKGGSDFSILSSSSQYKQESTYVPRKLDVLFVVDNSGSMSTSQTSLASHFPSFITYFKTKGYDFQIAVTTTDAYYGDQFLASGCSLCNVAQTKFRSGTNPKLYVINQNTTALESAFAQNVAVGTGGSGDERGFSSFKAALNSTQNAGFHRIDAFLSVIIVSDEEDFSHNDINLNESYAQPTLHTVASYKTFLETFTGGTANKDFSVSAIAVLDDACRIALANGQKIGTRYMQLADLTGGSKNSICSSFDTVLNAISAQIASQTIAQFQLSRAPIVASLRVIIDGVLVPQNNSNGWVYDSTTHIISIYGSYTPPAGALVTINFDPESIN
jgi:hypothetical protein